MSLRHSEVLRECLHTKFMRNGVDSLSIVFCDPCLERQKRSGGVHAGRYDAQTLLRGCERARATLLRRPDEAPVRAGSWAGRPEVARV